MKHSIYFDKTDKKILEIHILFFSLFLLFFSCDQTFEPLQENDEYYFSMYGYLDASADTQWVRVGIPRESINELPDPFMIKVTLENVETGQSVIMHDSLFASETLLNYWTTMPIENEETYRIKAEREDGKSSQVSVTIPQEFLTPLVIREDLGGYSIYIDDSVEHIADIQTKWYVILNPDSEKLERTYTFSYRNSVEHTTAFGGSYFALAKGESRYIWESTGRADRDVVHRQFFVAVAGPEWDESISDLNDLEYFLDGAASNVENGLGYVVGITSKWVPYETCLTPDESTYAPCPEEDPFW